MNIFKEAFKVACQEIKLVFTADRESIPCLLTALTLVGFVFVGFSLLVAVLEVVNLAITSLSFVWIIPVLLILFGAALTAYKIRQDKKK
jgi:sensor histidine kinase regulating citrate/malate metabolism